MKAEKFVCKCDDDVCHLFFLFLLPCFQEKYDKLVNEHGSLSNRLLQLQDDNQRDIETRIQVAI